MEQILVNIKDPAWWFTGVFFILVGILLTKLSSAWVPRLWRYVAPVVPRLTRRISRLKEKRILLRVKRHRQHQVKVNWLIARYWSLVTVLMMCLLFLGITYSLSSDAGRSGKEIAEFLPLVFPVYAGQFLVMWEKMILKRTVAAHIMWSKRIASRSSAVTLALR